MFECEKDLFQFPVFLLKERVKVSSRTKTMQKNEIAVAQNCLMPVNLFCLQFFKKRLKAVIY